MCRTSKYARTPQFQKFGTNRTQGHPHNTEQCTFCTHFTFALTISTYTPILALFLDPLHKKVPDQHICMHPTIPSVVPIEPRPSPQYRTVHFLHSFHTRFHHKDLYTELGPKISRPPSQKSAGPAYMYAPHNSKCGTNRTQAHPHNTKQSTFCSHFTFALSISTCTLMSVC